MGEKLTFRLQLVHSICWEADPDLGDVRHKLSEPGNSGIERIRFHLYHGIRGEPTAGSLPCHHTKLWQLWAGADVVRREDSALAKLLVAAMSKKSNELVILNPDQLAALGKNNLDLGDAQVEQSVHTLKQMFLELEEEQQRFFSTVAWSVGARSNSTITERGWPSIELGKPWFEFEFRPRATDWKREKIDLSRFSADADAPFSAALLGEAWQAVENSDRIAFVIAHMAMEAATKECISSIVTGGKHIVEGVQAPPLPNMFEMLLAHIQAELIPLVKDEDLWGKADETSGLSAASNWLRKRALARNKIVHGNTTPVSLDEVISWLLLYERLITLLWLERGRMEGVVGPTQALFEESWNT